MERTCSTPARPTRFAIRGYASRVAGELADLVAVADLTDRLLSALDEPGSDGLATDRFKTDLRALDARVLAKLGNAVTPSRMPRHLRLVDSLSE